MDIMNLITCTPLSNQAGLPGNIRDLRVAGVVDELTEQFLPFECDFLNLQADTWRQQISSFMPHMLFVESFWNGYEKTWREKYKPRNNADLVLMVNWCKARGVPTVFWNKEDPIHMLRFLATAFHFDYVFTTDMDCVPLYKRLLKHDRIGVLPFASSIHLFDPIEKYNRIEAACFAGSYYAKRIERKNDLEAIADTFIQQYSLDIYDRDPYPGNPDYAFPERFQKHIRGSLPVEEIDIAYKSYKIGITLNIVKNSSTMEARRIFELLSCNTFTVSNQCLGIKNLFGDLVLYYENQNQFLEGLKRILSDEALFHKTRLLALRKILTEHTYRKRLEYLYRKVFNHEPVSTDPVIAVFSIVSSREDAELMRKAFLRQTYPHKRLFLFTKDNSLVDEAESVYALNTFSKILSGQSPYYAYFSVRNYYGQNYLLDMILALQFAHVSAVGKSAYFVYREGEFVLKQGKGSYQFVAQILLDRCLFAEHLLRTLDPAGSLDTHLFDYVTCLSVDPYNFCDDFQGDSCEPVDDAEVDTGYSMEEIYWVSDSLSSQKKNYSFGKVFSIEELRESIHQAPEEFNLEEKLSGCLAFYSTNSSARKTIVSLDLNCSVEGLAKMDELTQQEILDVYLYGHFEGDILFKIIYSDQDGQYVGAYIICKNACTTLPVPNGAKTFCLQMILRRKTQGIIKEVLINPEIHHPIDIEAMLTHGQNV